MSASVESQKKQGNSRKKNNNNNNYFCFTHYTKAFDSVDHNKLWKILKQMGIPDHLTCLLRNLYAGQETTVRTGHGTTDWFQIGKGVCQGCLHCSRPGFDPWVGKIPWRRKWQPTPVFLPGKSHGLRSLVGYRPWTCKVWDTTEQLHFLSFFNRI